MVMSDPHLNEGFYKNVDESKALDWMVRTVKRHRPDELVVLGDWGSAWTRDGFLKITEMVHISGLAGNHDSSPMLKLMKNTDGTPVLCMDGEIRDIGGLRFGFINGIITQSPNVSTLSLKSASEYESVGLGLAGKIDVLCTHESPMREEFRHVVDAYGPETLSALIAKISPLVSFSGHRTPQNYESATIGGTANFVIESNQKSKMYAMFDTKDLRVQLWKDSHLITETRIEGRSHIIDKNVFSKTLREGSGKQGSIKIAA
jgi:Icc-related predicted phosphoesterase